MGDLPFGNTACHCILPHSAVESAPGPGLDLDSHFAGSGARTYHDLKKAGTRAGSEFLELLVNCVNLRNSQQRCRCTRHLVPGIRVPPLPWRCVMDIFFMCPAPWLVQVREQQSAAGYKPFTSPAMCG